MSAHDQLLRFNFDQLDIRGELVYLNNSWQQILTRYDYPPNVRNQLGSALAALVLLSATIKFDGNMILQVQGNGPLNKVVVQVTHDGAIRGLARWEGLVPDGSLKEVYGEGRILITVFKAAGDRYQSIVALEGNSLADALNVYFMQSEQLPSTFRLFATDTAVAGFFLQQLPDSRSTRDQIMAEHPNAEVPELQNREEDWNRVNILADTLQAKELLDLPPEQLLTRLFHEEVVSMHEPKRLRFSCTCSKEKVEGTLIALGRPELEDILKTEKAIEVDCEFCQQRYSFNGNDVKILFGDPSALPPGTIVH
ncbi:MAG: Hsp33 family molecular chaperone HslO [Pseudomonadota bacterium]